MTWTNDRGDPVRRRPRYRDAAGYPVHPDVSCGYPIWWRDVPNYGAPAEEAYLVMERVLGNATFSSLLVSGDDWEDWSAASVDRTLEVRA